MTVGATVRQANLHSLFTAAYGAPVGPQRLRLFTTGYFHSNDPVTAACYVGAFPTGTAIDWFHSGTICGARGVPNSGSGGHCIVGQPGVTINLRNSGTIYAGGGAGGYGGTGGMGYYITTSHLGQSGVYGWCDMHNSCAQTFGAGAYCTSNGDGWCTNCACYCFNCWRDDPNYTSGGGGGSGGYGTGVYDTAGNQAGATGGNAGAGGGTNAGSGGYGGSGGGWGGAGATGATGNSGNYTGGSGGSGGGGAGYWRVSNGSTFNLISNTGNIAGNAN